MEWKKGEKQTIELKMNSKYHKNNSNNNNNNKFEVNK